MNKKESRKNNEGVPVVSTKLFDRFVSIKKIPYMEYCDKCECGYSWDDLDIVLYSDHEYYYSDICFNAFYWSGVYRCYDCGYIGYSTDTNC